MNIDVLHVIAISMGANLPLLLLGDPGAGKTQSIVGLAKRLGFTVKTIHLSHYEPTDLTGLPREAGGVIQYVPHRWMLELTERTVLFLDELSAALPATMHVAQRSILERILGDTVLPAGMRIMAAANPPESARGTNQIPQPFLNRVIVVRVETDPNAWIAGMASGFNHHQVAVLESDWEKHRAKWVALVIEYIRCNPKMLSTFKPEEEQSSFGSERSWDFLATVLAACEGAQASPEVFKLMGGGTIGATEFKQFWLWTLTKENLPSPEELLRNPKLLSQQPPDIIQVGVESVIGFLRGLKESDRNLKQSLNNAVLICVHMSTASKADRVIKLAEYLVQERNISDARLLKIAGSAMAKKP